MPRKGSLVFASVFATCAVGFLYAQRGLAEEYSPPLLGLQIYDGKIAQASGVVFMAKRIVEKASVACESTDSRLYTAWIIRNKEIVDKAAFLLNRVLDHLEARQGKHAVDEYWAEVTPDIEKNSTEYVASITSQSAENRTLACTRLSGEITRGQWDVQYLDPEIFSFLTEQQ